MVFSGQLHAPVALHPQRDNSPDTHGTKDWVDPQVSLEPTEKRKIPFLQDIQPRITLTASCTAHCFSALPADCYWKFK
jgi:hypothetical protein